MMKKASLFIALLATLCLGLLLGIKLQKEVSISAVAPTEIEDIFRLMEAKYHTKINRQALIQNTIDRIKRENETSDIYEYSERLKRINEQLDLMPAHRQKNK